MSHEETNEIDISIQPIVYDNASLDSLFTFIEDFEDFKSFNPSKLGKKCQCDLKRSNTASAS